ncbi:MAG: thioesterase family protein [Anaerolineae bacterium]|nr:MAG: thioesterase family protein [Anaerolineae bacterium]
MTQIRPLLVELQFRVKTYDIDYAGIVHNGVYIRWLEDLRLKIVDEHLPLKDQLNKKQSPILEKTEITYRLPLRLFEEPKGIMWVSKLGRARWEVQAEFILSDKVVADASQRGYFMDLVRYRPIRIPKGLRDKWESETKRDT